MTVSSAFLKTKSLNGPMFIGALCWRPEKRKEYFTYLYDVKEI